MGKPPASFRKRGRKGRNQAKKGKVKKSLKDHVFFVGTATQASNYQATVDFCINHIILKFEHGNDIAESLCMMMKIKTSTWKPSLRSSEKDGSDKRRREDPEFEILYKIELDEYMQREHIYKEGMIKAY
eukprot:3917090-Ditylum_brightwellii.AAC.1